MINHNFIEGYKKVTVIGTLSLRKTYKWKTKRHKTCHKQDKKDKTNIMTNNDNRVICELQFLSLRLLQIRDDQSNKVYTVHTKSHNFDHLS